MKLTHLIAQYLYKTKRLELQGIGSFILEGPIDIDLENEKSQKEARIEGISFQNDQSIKKDPELIAFLSTHSGKIKALAAADLDSHLELAKQFLNIGKPFLLEGIGSLTKIRSGEYAFTPGTVLTEKFIEQKIKTDITDLRSEEPASDYKAALYKRPKTTNWKKPITFLLVILGIAIAIWGGYAVYKRNADKKQNLTEPKDKTILIEDNIPAIKDSINIETPATTVNTSGLTKFVLEISDRTRAFERYNQLKTYLWDVHMETKDSISYKLFLSLPVSPADTSRVVDSISILYGRKVFIER